MILHFIQSPVVLLLESEIYLGIPAFNTKRIKCIVYRMYYFKDSLCSRSMMNLFSIMVRLSLFHSGMILFLSCILYFNAFCCIPLFDYISRAEFVAIVLVSQATTGRNSLNPLLLGFFLNFLCLNENGNLI